MYWQRSRVPQIRELIRKDPVVVVAVGSLEQHGPHLATGCDTLSAQFVVDEAARICDGVPPLLILPPIAYGYSPHHLSLGGTVTLEPSTLIGVIRDIGTSVLSQGVRRLVFVNGHGGNTPTVSLAVAELGRNWFGRARVVTLTYWFLATEQFAESRESKSGGTGHAGEFETSLMLAIDPTCVDMSCAQTSYPKTLSAYQKTDLFESSVFSTFTHFEDLSPTGVFGDPRLATAEKGKRIVAMCADGLAGFLKDFATWRVGQEEGKE